MIDGALIKQLRVVPDERGFLMEMLRNDDPFFQRFGQAYITACYPGVVKGWHYHRIQTDHFVCVKGMAKVVLYDSREDSPTHGKVQEVFMGERNPILLRIPSHVMHGFKAVGTETAMIINFPTELYNHNQPDEYRMPWDTPEIPYDWGLKNG